MTPLPTYVKGLPLLGQPLRTLQMEQPEDRIERAIVFIASICKGRALAVSFFYWTGCLMLGAGGWKATVVFFLTYVAQILPVGQRRIERFGLLFLGVATAYWVDIVPMHQWTSIARDRFAELLQHARF
jgi:hypothetical protein